MTQREKVLTMNSELIDKALLESDLVSCIDYDVLDYEECLNKFAELIVNECLNIRLEPPCDSTRKGPESVGEGPEAYTAGGPEPWHGSTPRKPYPRSP